MKKHLLSPSFYVLLCLAAGFCGVKIAQAVTTTIISSAIQQERHRVSYTEVKNTPSVADPDGTCNGLAKRVVIDTVPAGGQLLSVVTHANTAFVSTSTVDEIHIQSIVAEQSGVEVSQGNIGMPNSSMMDSSYTENRIPASSNYNFYDESATWDVVAYFCAENSGTWVNLNSLTAGSVDFYELVTK
jgi:hypothetical protein